MEILPQTASTTEAPTASFEVPSPAVTRRLPRPRTALGLIRHLGLPVVIVLAAVLNTHRLAQNGYANVFYSAGVRSMLLSLHNFFFNAFDPGGLITIDKPPLALWVQAASAKVFGLSPLSLLLPEAIAGVLAVAALYLILARRLGALPAFAGAFALAVFPSFVAVSRDNGVDPLLILLLVLACGTGLRACETGRWRWLLLSGAIVGLAFNTKTLAAYLAVPGIAVGFLVCAPGTIWRRLLQLAAGGLVLAVVSFAWIAAVELTPASHRPYVGGSTDDTELSLTFEYNGLGRVEGQQGGPNQVKVRPGARLPPVPHRARLTPHERRVVEAQNALAKSTFLPNGHFKNVTPFGDSPSPVRLFGKGLGDQGGWLLPFAAFGLLALALLALPMLGRDGQPGPDRREHSPDQEQAGGEDDPGRGRIARIVPAALRAPRSAAPTWRRDPRLATLLVLGGWFFVEAVVLSLSKGIVHPYYISALGPGTAAMAGGAVYALARLRRGPQPWVAVALAGLAMLTTIAVQLVLLWREQYMLWLGPVLVAGALAGLLVLLLVRRLAAPAVAFLLALLLIAPTAYSATTWQTPVEGTFAAAGPKAATGEGGVGASPRTAAVYHALLRYALTHDPGRRFTLLTVASDTAAPMILLGYKVAALGGYSGTDPALDGPMLARMVRAHEARYVVLGGVYSTRGGNKATQATLRYCHLIPPRAWHSPDPYSDGLPLFDCAGHERQLESAT